MAYTYAEFISSFAEHAVACQWSAIACSTKDINQYRRWLETQMAGPMIVKLGLQTLASWGCVRHLVHHQHHPDDQSLARSCILQPHLDTPTWYAMLLDMLFMNLDMSQRVSLLTLQFIVDFQIGNHCQRSCITIPSSFIEYISNFSDLSLAINKRITSYLFSDIS